MFDKYKEERIGTKSHDATDCEDLAQRAAVLETRSRGLLVEKTIRQIIEPLEVDLAFLKTHIGQVIDKQQETMHHMDVRLVPISTHLAEIDTRQKQILYALERVEKKLAQLSAESKLLENASRENQLLTEEHYNDHVIQPIVRSLFPIVDFINDARNSRAENRNNGEMPCEELEDGVLLQLCQFLSTYKVELIRHKAGAKFDAREMRPVKKVPTSDKRLDCRVVKSLQAGFREQQRQRLLRPESVVLYKYHEKENPQNIFKEGGIK